MKSQRISARKEKKQHLVKNKTRQKKTTSEPAAPVGGTSRIAMFYFLVGLVPCYLV